MKMRKILADVLSEGLDRFSSLRMFYAWKHKIGGYGLFSCAAAECFPEGWIQALADGVWNEEGTYGDNFRKAFELRKT